MVTIVLSGINPIRRRLADGTVRTYYYHRATKIRLPDDPTSAEFVARLAELNAPGPAEPGTKPGSFRALIAEYKGAPEFKQIGKKAQRDYGRYLDLVRDLWADLPVAKLERKHVFRLRDKYAETPRTANYVIAVLRRLLSFAVDRGYRKDNPALRPQELKTGEGHRPWPETAIDAFRAKHARGSEMRLALELGLTGQREGDVVAMTKAGFDGTGIELTQSKRLQQTGDAEGAKIWVPCPLETRLAIEAMPKDRLLLLLTPTGKPYKVDYFSHQFHDAVIAAGLEALGLTFHGLRHTTGTVLAEAGCSEAEIMAVTGHTTSASVRRYTRRARQRTLAKLAAAKRDD